MGDGYHPPSLPQSPTTKNNRYVRIKEEEKEEYKKKRENKDEGSLDPSCS
jgi:hypothetical protein